MANASISAEGVHVTDADLKRFWAKVQIAGPDECWNWTAGLSAGYGSFCLSGRRYIRAHRLSLLLAQPVERRRTLHACHSCDNPRCVNPAHLWWGTAADNIRDAAAKGRCAMQRADDPRRSAYVGDRNPMRKHAHLRAAQSERQRGSKSHRAKLNEQQVAEIKQLRSAGVSQYAVAAQFGVSREMISRIDRGKAWTHV